MKHMKRFAAAFAALVLISSFGACGSRGSASSDSNTPVRGGDLVMVRSGDATSMLPTAVTDNTDIWVQELIYEPLLLPKADGSGVQPAVADKYEQSSDGLSWTFHIRKGVKFSDGTPITSADVKFSIEQASKDDAPFSFTNSSIADIETPSDDSVVIKTNQPWSPLPSDLAIFSNAIVPKDYGGKSAEEFAKHPIGSGPFVFKEWKKGQQIKLVRNDNYRISGKPYLDSVTIKVVSDDNTRTLQLQGGQAQVDEYPPYSSVRTLSKSKTVHVKGFTSSRVDYLSFNTAKEPFNDVHLRRAISYAIDRSALNKAVLYGNGEPAKAYLTPALWAHAEDKDIKDLIGYNMNKAKEELAKSKLANGGTITLLVESGNADQNTMAQIIQNSLSKLNLSVKIKQMDSSAKYDAMRGGNFDMGFSYCTTDIVDPDEIIRFVADYNGGSKAMYSQYNNKEISDLADKAASTSDQDKRQEYYTQIQQIWNDDSPAAALFYSPSIYAWTSNVHGFSVYPTGNYDLVNTWMTK